MPITVRDLLDLPRLGLSCVAGEEGLDSAIRWSHTSELEDPTPWLSGGELLLTTGMKLTTSPALQRAYVRRLAKAGLAGLGFGVGFSFEEVPESVRKTADRVGFPVLEVPYPVPFIAITEAISAAVNEDRLRDAQLSVEVHERLAGLVSEGAGPADVLDEVVGLAAGWAMLFDPRGKLVARSSREGTHPPPPEEVWRALPSGLMQQAGPSSAVDIGPRGTRVGVAVTAGKRDEGVFIFGKEEHLDQRDRITVHHGATVLGLLMASRRAVIEMERQVAGDVLAEAFAGHLSGRELQRRLELVGFPPGAPLVVLLLEAEGSSDAQLLDELAWEADALLRVRVSAVRTAVVGQKVAVLTSHQDPEELAGILVGSSSVGPEVRVGVGEVVATESVRRSYLSALFAMQAAPARRIAGPRDLGSYGFLLGAPSRSVLEGFVRSVLGPLIERDRDRSSDLVSSVRAFIAAGGRWEAGAEALGIHRHTLRYRVRLAEEVLGRDLASAEDRFELWLALKAADVLAE
jgi:purine catabolism regulator